MLGNKYLLTLLAAGALLGAGTASGGDLALEPCANGHVSPSGTYPSAQLERVADGYQTWADFRPYYLFAVSATYLESPFEVTEDGAEGKAEPN